MSIAALALTPSARAQDVCDLDGDGFEALGCGGTDCDDMDGEVSPSALEVDADGLDQDCDGLDSCSARWVQGGMEAPGGCAAAPAAGPGAALASALALIALGARRRRA